MSLYKCPVCDNEDIVLFKQVNEYTYFECNNCSLIFISPDILERMDQGESIFKYNSGYWKDELFAARERSWGSSLARIAELFLYARIPVKKFIDIGSGPGFLLDALSYQLPSANNVFYANELFPPASNECTSNKNYHRGNFVELGFEFEAGCCVEVIEHISPLMLKTMMSQLAEKSKPNSIYIFNTGLVEFVKNEDPTYLDPLVRGHIVSWSIPALQTLLEPLGFQILSIPGKSWAFIAEYKPDHVFTNPLNERIWYALPENIEILKDKKTGDLMYILGLETARAYS
jgi:hypothetical protein